MKKKYVVIGGGGFIGSNLIDTLVNRKKMTDVICIDRGEPYTRIVGCKYTKADLSMTDILSSSIDSDSHVIHLAWNSVPNTFGNAPSDDVRNNLLTSISLFETCVQNNARSIVFLSSGGGIYGKPIKVPIDEYHPTFPLSFYGINKLAVENYLRLITKGTSTKGVVLRVSNPYGRFQKPFTGQGVIATFLASALLNNPVTVWGDGKAVRDYIYIDDLIEVICKACKTELDFIVANTGSEIGTSIDEIIELVGEISGKKLKVLYTAKTDAEPDRNILNCNYAGQMLNWKAKTMLIDGIKRMYSFWNQETNQFDLQGENSLSE